MNDPIKVFKYLAKSFEYKEKQLRFPAGDDQTKLRADILKDFADILKETIAEMEEEEVILQRLWDKEFEKLFS